MNDENKIFEIVFANQRNFTAVYVCYGMYKRWQRRHAQVLYKIAQKYNTTVAELERLNDLDEEEKIKPGCKLIIPGRAIF